MPISDVKERKEQMKKLLLIVAAIMAMAGFASAQSCGDNSTYGTQGPCPQGSVCGCQNGRSDCAGPSCVNLQTSKNNCGSLGNTCDGNCIRGECECVSCVLPEDPNQTAKRRPRVFALKSTHSDITDALKRL